MLARPLWPGPRRASKCDILKDNTGTVRCCNGPGQASQTEQLKKSGPSQLSVLYISQTTDNKQTGCQQNVGYLKLAASSLRRETGGEGRQTLFRLPVKELLVACLQVARQGR